MNSMHSVPTVGSGHVGNSCFRHFKTQGTGFLRHTGTPGYGIFGKVSFLKNEASTSPGFRKVITESQFLSSTRLYNSLGRTGRALASGGGSGNGNSNGGSGDGDNNDDSSSSGGWFGPFWAMYLAQLDKNPVVTKAVTAGILNGIGDILAQVSFSEQGQDFDWKRLGIFTFLGMAFIGPALHVWYGTLASVFANAGTMSALGRLAMDQLFFAPIFIGSIISLIMALEGQGEQVPTKIKNDLFTIVKSNWVLWVPFQFINFRYVPQHLQVLASNVVALGWNTYMSWASHKI